MMAENEQSGVDWRWIVGISGAIITLLITINIGVISYVFSNLSNRVAMFEESIAIIKSQQQPSIQQIERIVILEQRVESLTRELQRLTAELQAQRFQTSRNP